MQKESVRSVKPNIRSGEKITHQAYSILKNLQRNIVIKPPMSKTMKKVDKGNEETNQMSVSKNSRECTRET